MLTLHINEISQSTLLRLQAILAPTVTLRLTDEQMVEVVRDEEVVARLIYQPQSKLPPGLTTAELTPRQKEVLPLLLAGLTNQAIAHRLGISAKGVEYHITAILRRLKFTSRVELLSHFNQSSPNHPKKNSM